jgi:DNA topoisomerase VI subunit B
MSCVLHRELFETKRQLEYFSPKELSMQLGAEPRRWGVVLIKEAVDNALDACETAGLDPVIAITLGPEGFTVEDNGLGMSQALIERSLDYDIRVSDKTYYVSPTRGQLGNALKCLWAAPYAIDEGAPGSVEVISQGLQHRIAVTVDRIAQEPRLQHTITEAPICKNGTRITVTAPKLACYHRWSEIDDFYKSVEVLLEQYAAFNPHVSFTLTTPAFTRAYSATTPAWKKWRPSDPTSPRWYECEHFTALIAAYLYRERVSGAKARTLRAFVSEFAGLSASAQQKAVLEAASLSGRYLHDLVKGDAFLEADIQTLLSTMQSHSRPITPQALGVLGKPHLCRVLDEHHHVDPSTIAYKKVIAEASGLPFVLEVAFGVVRKDDEQGQDLRVITGINWSATPTPPFEQLDSYLSTALVSRGHHVVVVVHLAIPRPTFRDRGKQALALPEAIEWALEPSVKHVTKRWTEKRRQEMRSDRADARAEELMRKQERAHYPGIKEAAYQLMPRAYQDASGQGTYVAHARQIMYAARPKLLAMIHPDKAAKGLKAQYFTQTLVPDYMTEHPNETAGWDVIFDDRGHFREPHRQNGRERIIGLGTLAVRQYIASWQGTVRDTLEHIFLPFDLKTSGPTHRYQAVLFIEKEGFDELIQQAQIAERFDIAPMSTKGMSNTAARRLVDELSLMGVTIYVLHDFDKSGFSILHTLRTNTRRYQFKSEPKVIDLGLTLADVQGMALQSEPVNCRQRKDPRLDLARCEATPDEQAFLFTGARQRNPSTGKYYWPGQRVELNAMTSDQFVEWIERRLTEEGVTKVIPTPDTLAHAYRRAVRTKAINEELARIQEQMQEGAIQIPDDLQDQVQAVLQEHPELSWDAAVWKLVQGDLDTLEAEAEDAAHEEPS